MQINESTPLEDVMNQIFGTKSPTKQTEPAPCKTLTKKLPYNVMKANKSENLYIEVIAPGFDKEDISIQIEGDMLTVSSDFIDDLVSTFEVKTIAYKCEPFKNTFSLHENYVGTKIEAAYENGIVTISIAKKESVTPSSRVIVID